MERGSRVMRFLRRTRSEAGTKDLIYARLEEAMERPECPICLLLTKAERGLIEEILYEHVQDPAVRKQLRSSLGLCPYHAWLLHDISLSRPEMNGLGVTIIYEDMLSTYLEALTSGEEQESKVGGGPCIVCEHVMEFEAGYIEAFAERAVRTDLLTTYEESPSVLCIRHYRAVRDALKGVGGKATEILERLKAIQGRKIESLIKLMREYVRKQDYRVKEEITAEEARAWRVALHVLKGGRNSPSILSYKIPKPKRGILAKLSRRKRG